LATANGSVRGMEPGGLIGGCMGVTAMVLAHTRGNLLQFDLPGNFFRRSSYLFYRTITNITVLTC
jgi:hypothetical protein